MVAGNSWKLEQSKMSDTGNGVRKEEIWEPQESLKLGEQEAHFI